MPLYTSAHAECTRAGSGDQAAGPAPDLGHHGSRAWAQGLGSPFTSLVDSAQRCICVYELLWISAYLYSLTYLHTLTYAI